MSGEFTKKSYDKMKNCIAEHCMLSSDEAIIACVSGGCDSVALLFLLKKFIDEEGKNRKLICAHFDHMLRGAESDGDREFTEKLCKSLGVIFECERQDAALYSKENSLSLETGAREIRYDFFQKLSKEYKAKIAVAHNMNDRIETVIMNIARGTGIHGLKGISYTRDNIIRPLLDISRLELEQVLEENNISFRTDSSNSHSFCRRNKIRLEILPYLRENLGNDIDDKIIRLSRLATEDNDYIESEAEKLFTAAVENTEGQIVVDYNSLQGIHTAVLSRLAVRILEEFYPGGMGITEATVSELKRALGSTGAGYSGQVGKGLFVRVYHDRLVLSQESLECKNSLIGEISFSRETVDVAAVRKSGNMLAAFDEELLCEYCKEKNALWEIRGRKEGDYFTPLGSKGGKLLKKFFIDNKVPADIRNSIPLLAVGNEILWIPGVRRSNVAPVGKDTGHVILFRYGK